MKRIIKNFMIFLCLSYFFISLGAAPSEASKLKTLASLKKIDDFPMYTMEYFGDYAFDEYLKQGSKDLNELSQFLTEHHLITYDLKNWKDDACTGFIARNSKGEVLFGRNLDISEEQQAVLLLHTHPSTGYAATSLVRSNLFNGNTGNDLKDKKPVLANILAAPYFPNDGMNECGVAVANLTVPEWRPKKDPSKVTLYRWTVIRLILDYTKNVDEAIALVRMYNLNDNNGNGLHFFVADASGNSAVIESNDGRIEVTKNEKPWQVVANFLLYNNVGAGGRGRYAVASTTLADKKGVLSETDSMKLLRTVCQYDTVWSAVYNLNTKELNLVLGRQYDRINKFSF